MTSRYSSFLIYIGLVACFNAAPAALYGAENDIEFSGQVPARLGDLSFGPVHAYAEGDNNRAGLQLLAENHGSTKAQLSFEAFDDHFNPIDDIALPPKTILQPEEARHFLLALPIVPGAESRYRICAILKSSSAKQSRLCGKYIALQR